MRVLTFTSLYPSCENPRTGLFVEARLVALAREAGVSADVIAPVPWFPLKSTRWGSYARFGRMPSRETRKGIEVLHPRYAMVPRVGMLTQPLAMAWATLPMVRRQEQRNGPYDVVDAHYFYPDGVAAAILARRFGYPLVITARGSDINLIGGLALPRRMIVWAAGQAQRIVAVSAALRDSLINLGANAANIEVVRNGVDTGTFQPEDRNAARARWGLPAQTPIVLAVGNLVPEKGHDLLIDAIQEVPGATLVIVGEGPERRVLEHRIQHLALGDRIQLRGSMAQEDLVSMYGAADVVALTSVREGMPNVLLEALACGRPVVATTVGGVPEVITDSVAGCLVSERSPTLVASALRVVLAQPHDPKAIRAHVKAWDWSAVGRAHLEVLRGAVGQQSRRRMAAAQ